MARVLFFLFTLFYLSASSQSSHEEARALLDECRQGIRSLPQLEMHFTWTVWKAKALEASNTSEGVLQLAADRYRWKLQDIEQICDGERVFTILHEDEEVQIHEIDASEGDQGSHPLKILDSYDKGYSFRLGGREDADGGKVQFVVLTPHASEVLRRVSIGIRVSDKRIHSVEQWMRSGARMKMEVDRYDASTPLDTSVLEFSTEHFPDYYIPRD
ncbi:MAG: Uncharacterised protein [Flavobacteriia bacterium]|nr:MAG: Uncharacterised protein [Flavobacteriia bacterium]